MLPFWVPLAMFSHWCRIGTAVGMVDRPVAAMTMDRNRQGVTSWLKSPMPVRRRRRITITEDQRT